MSENATPYKVEPPNKDNKTSHKAIPNTADRLRDFYQHLFDTLEILLAKHRTFGNWSFGGGIPELKSLSAQTELGLWYAESHILSFPEPAAISLVVLPNECRIGLFLPNDCLIHEMGERTLDHDILEIYGKEIPGVHVFARKIGDRTLFDHILHDPPFDTDSLAKAMQEQADGEYPASAYFALLAQRIAYIVATIWTGAIRTVYEQAKTGMGTWIIWTDPDVRLQPHHMHGLPGGYLLRSNEVGLRIAVEMRTTATAEAIRQHFAHLGIPILEVEKMMEVNY